MNKIKLLSILTVLAVIAACSGENEPAPPKCYAICKPGPFPCPKIDCPER